jgi:hypothetical protein
MGAAAPGPVTEQRSRFRIVAGTDQQTFHLRPSRGLMLMSLVFVFILGDFALLLMLTFTIGGLTPGSGLPLATGIVSLIATPVLAYTMFQAQFRPAAVIITPSELRARGLSGRTKSAAWSEIARIELRDRTYGRSVTRVRVPYVWLVGRRGFWLDGLAGDLSRRPPDPAQLELLTRLRAMLPPPAPKPRRRRWFRHHRTA